MNKKESILDFEDKKEDGVEISAIINSLKKNAKLFGAVVISSTSLSVIYALLLTPIFQAEVVAIPAEQSTSIGSLSSSFSLGKARAGCCDSTRSLCLCSTSSEGLYKRSSKP